MKIAILSMQRVVNYGSVLQAYSLKEMIREIHGDDPDFLDIKAGMRLESRRSVCETKADYADRSQLPGGIAARAKRWTIARLSGFSKRLIRAFMHSMLKLDDSNASAKYDCVVIGSDEVFNHAGGVSLQLHGQVEQAARVISYAASCGSACAEDIRPEDLPVLRNAMRSFEAMSVRDKGTQAYVSSLYDGKVERHMDPVLMGPLCRRKPGKVPLRKYLLVYAYGHRIHTEDEVHAIQAYAREHGLKTVAMGGSQFWCDLFIPASPLRMLDYFAHADCVVTDTFHGIVFSVLHHKRFAAIVRKSNSNKMNGLLEELGLAHHRAKDMKELSQLLQTEIDYQRIEAYLDQERVRARAYLKEHLYS